MKWVGMRNMCSFLLGLIVIIVYWKWRILKVRLLKKYKYSQTSRKQPPKMSSLQVQVVTFRLALCPVFFLYVLFFMANYAACAKN